MFKLNLKIALRNLWRNKVSAFINISGLSIGLAACLMLLIYVSYEWNFDKQWANSDNIYDVMTNVKDDKGKIFLSFDGTTTAFGPLVKQNIPDVKDVARASYIRPALLAHDNNSFKKDGRFAEPDILKIFDYKFISGDAKTALNEPYSVILTERMAETLFGTTDVLNKAVRYQDKFDLKVTGVIKNLPDNSSNKFEFLMPWSFWEIVDPQVKELNWDSYSYMTTLTLKPGVDPAAVNVKIDAMMKKLIDQTAQAHFIFPMNKLHLYGKFEEGKSVGGAIEQVWLFVGLAFGILLIACINFMNMATAKSEKRAKEVGIKKTIGANRKALIAQFLTESMVLTLVSVLIAIAIIELSLPSFSNLLGIQLSMDYFSGVSWIGIPAIVLLTGLLAGSYPAFYLSSFNPIQNFKKKISSGGMLSFGLRQVLVVGQFAFTIVLIVATLVIYKQIQFIKNRPIGADVNALVEIPQDGNLKQQFDVLKTRLISDGAVTAMCKTSINLSHYGHNFRDIRWPGMQGAENTLMFNRIVTTYDFIKTNGIKLLQGRDFSPQYGADSASIMVSASAAKVMGLKQPVGQVVQLLGDPVTIVGVFEDYIWGSPYATNNPMVVSFDKKWTSWITMRLNPEKNLEESVARINAVVKEINPAYPVEVKFMSDIYRDKFKSEATLGILSNLFGGLAIFISCLGLYGLVAYSAEQRTKEFGVRKVLGASVFSLMRLLSLSFVKMILVAMVIAIPAAYYMMDKWLVKFEFRTTISWWVFALAAAGTLIIALVTVSSQAYKSARANPVDALKYE